MLELQQLLIDGGASSSARLLINYRNPDGPGATGEGAHRQTQERNGNGKPDRFAAIDWSHKIERTSLRM